MAKMGHEFVKKEKALTVRQSHTPQGLGTAFINLDALPR
jgi:hypothetical protein